MEVVEWVEAVSELKTLAASHALLSEVSEWPIQTIHQKHSNHSYTVYGAHPLEVAVVLLFCMHWHFQGHRDNVLLASQLGSPYQIKYLLAP